MNLIEFVAQTQFKLCMQPPNPTTQPPSHLSGVQGIVVMRHFIRFN